MNLIQRFAALNIVALSAKAGSANIAQCNGHSALWINPILCTDETSKCSDSQILSALNYDVFDVAWEPSDENQVDMVALGNGQCNGHSTLWLSPSLCADTAMELSKCSDAHILSASDFEMYDIEDDEQVNSLLTNFLTWASITRDVEMQKDLCEVPTDTMPWNDIQMCDGDLKLVHRTQPMLGRTRDYNFEPKNNPAMSGKDTGAAKTSGFGLPREKVRKFMSMLKPKPLHWHKIRPELYI